MLLITEEKQHRKPADRQTATLTSHTFSTGELRALWSSIPLAFKHPVLHLRNHIRHSGVGTMRL